MTVLMSNEARAELGSIFVVLFSKRNVSSNMSLLSSQKGCVIEKVWRIFKDRISSRENFNLYKENNIACKGAIKRETSSVSSSIDSHFVEMLKIDSNKTKKKKKKINHCILDISLFLSENGFGF